MIQIEMGGFTRIQKRTAQRLWLTGRKVYMQSSNFRPDNMYQPAIPVSSPEKYDGFRNPETFEKILNYFSAYNCPNSETGRSINFWIRNDGK